MTPTDGDTGGDGAAKPRVRIGEDGNVVVGLSGAPGAPPIPPQDKAASEDGDLPPLPSPNEELRSEYDRRIMRRIAFGVFGLLALAFFFILALFLLLGLLGWFASIVFQANALSAVLGSLNAHAVVIITVVMVIAATVPISLVFGLIRLSNDGPTQADLSEFTTPQVRAAVSLLDCLKSVFGKG